MKTYDLIHFCIDLAITTLNSYNAFSIQRECKDVLNEDISIYDIVEYLKQKHNNKLLGINESEMIKFFQDE